MLFDRHAHLGTYQAISTKKLIIINRKCLKVEAAGLMKSREGDFSISYADVAQGAFSGGPEQYRKYSVAAR